MTISPTPRPARAGRRAAGVVAFAVVAAGATTVASALLGVGPSPAAADPGDTFVAIGSSQLLTSEDLQAIQVPLDTQKVVLNRDGDFSSCLGEGNAWTEVLPGSAAPVTGTWTRRGHRSESLSESITQASSEAQAERWAGILIDSGIRACRRPTTDFHYGAIHTDPVGSGTATWALSYRGTSKVADGGVVVFRKGTTVGFVQVNGTWGPASPLLESVAKEATSRLR